MDALTATQVGDILLFDLGIISRDTASPAVQSNKITSNDLLSVSVAMTQAYQEMFEDETGEPRTRPGSAYLRAPTTVTLTVTLGSTTISALATFATWMPGCTIRIAGDDQDNELLSETMLARPCMAPTGSVIAATVWCDAITLDGTVGRVLAPMFLQDGSEVHEVTSRKQFILSGGYPARNWEGYGPAYWGIPFYSIAQKPTGTPCVFFLDGFYDPTLDFVQRRIRLSPMPGSAASLGYTATINPPRVSVDDIDGPSHADPGVKIPVVNGWAESVFLPIARWINMGNPRFKNDGIKPFIQAQYDAAKRRLKGANVSAAPVKTFYI